MARRCFVRFENNFSLKVTKPKRNSRFRMLFFTQNVFKYYFVILYLEGDFKLLTLNNKGFIYFDQNLCKILRLTQNYISIA